MVSKVAALGLGVTMTVTLGAIGSPVASASIPAHYPIGHQDSVRATGVAGPGVPTGWHSGSYVNASGWSFDPDAKSTSEVVRSYDGPTLKWRYNTTVYRPDVNHVYGLIGHHGYSIRYPVANGTHRICTLQENLAAGVSDWSNCINVTINGSPYGAFDTLNWASATSIRFSGWTADPDDTRMSTTLTYTVDGGAARSAVANGSRSDVNATVRIPGNHGFMFTMNVPAGPASHTVCVTAVNYGPRAPNTSLGCKTTASTAWAWGWNYAGQLGDGNLTDTNKPVQIHIPNGVVSIASTSQAGYAVTPGGAVWSWGYGGHPGCGCYVPNPVQVPNLSRIVQVAGGGFGAYALRNDGTVWTWGTTRVAPGGDESTPFQISGLRNITVVAGGDGDGYALRADGTVWAWGNNERGQLGTGATSIIPCSCTTPAMVSGLNGVTAISSEGDTIYALKSDGTVWAWGRNDENQLGNASVPTSGCYCSATPVQVSLVGSATGIAAGTANGYALLSDGTVWGWGNGNCNLPSGSQANQVTGLSGITQIAAGAEGLYALRSDGTELAAGGNIQGQLGNGAPPQLCGSTSSPVQVSGISHIHQLAAGIQSGYAITTP